MFELIGKIIVGVALLWIGSGVLMLAFGTSRIPAEVPWSARIWIGVLSIAIMPWMLLRYGFIPTGVAVYRADETRADLCNCQGCKNRRAFEEWTRRNGEK